MRGPLFALLTLAFAVAANSWIFNQSWFLGDSTLANIPRGSLGPFDLGSQRAYYYLCLVVVVMVALGLGRLRRTGVGRAIVAVRDNERGAASFTISPHARQAHRLRALRRASPASPARCSAGCRCSSAADSFRPDLSFLVVAIAVIGGLGSVAGAVLGAVYVLGVPALFGHSLEVQLLTSGAGLLVLLLVLPGGLVELAARRRDRLVVAVGRRRPIAAGADATSPPMPIARREPPRRPRAIADDAGVALRASRHRRALRRRRRPRRRHHRSTRRARSSGSWARTAPASRR